MSNAIRIGKDRAENTETSSSPHTFAPSGAGVPSGFYDNPTVSDVRVYPAEEIPLSTACAAALRQHSQQQDAPIESTTRTVNKVTFEINNITPPIANMIRRVILSEVPTMAFDRVLIEENDGVVLDEILSHRLGQLPLVAPVDKFQFVTSADVAFTNAAAPTAAAGATGSSSTTLSLHTPDPQKMVCFELDVVGGSQPVTTVYSGHLKWINLGGIQSQMTEKDVYIVHKDIPLAKLGPMQRIKLRVFAIKGLGQCHTKWSPASACFYKFKTVIKVDQQKLHKLNEGDEMNASARRLADCCPKRVFELEEIAKSAAPSGGIAVVDASRCSLCRECLNEFGDIVMIEKLPNTVQFTIESMGQYPAQELVPLGMRVFAERCRSLGRTIKTTPPFVTKALQSSS